jgi:hypothetical protein
VVFNKTDLNGYQFFVDCDSTGTLIMVNNNYSTDGETTWKTLVGHPIYPGNSFVCRSQKHHLSLGW